jgi:4-hydroxythreonine-4-phosphate dehydrogenase
VSSNAPSAPLVVTPGEPAGIGPDLLLALVAEGLDLPIVVLADPDLMRARARLLGLQVAVEEAGPGVTTGEPGRLRVQPVPLARQVSAGQPDAVNAASLLAALDAAVDGCLRGRYSALVTGPVNKALINAAGTPFSGHTEYLAQRCAAPQPVMLLCGGAMRVALVTTHLPLRAVSDAICEQTLDRVLRVLDRDMQLRFGIERPRILVLALNPHAGEDGYLGDEEARVIAPVIARLREEGLALSGPAPADTAFNPQQLDQVDVVLAMYHDQGLPVLKHASFGTAVNVTLGLPIIRTSVDHGTAFELAGSGRADAQSLREALYTAARMAARDAGT